MSGSGIVVRTTRPEDISAIQAMCTAVYPGTPTWSRAQLESHLRVFPEGQFVAHSPDGELVGMAASLIILWDDYRMEQSWRDFTDHGMFTNHDPARGHTLYGAEVMTHPAWQGKGVGSALYAAREELVRRRELLRIRAGARLRGYHHYSAELSAEEYVVRVVGEELRDPTLSFQLHRGFEVLAVVSGYLLHDPESLGYAAVIEWLNEAVATPKDREGRDPRFLKAAKQKPAE